MRLLSEVVASPGLDVVRIVCLDTNGRILLVQETDDINWKLPGGKMHKGESVLVAARREIQEELGYSLQQAEITNIVKALIPDSENYRYIMLVQIDASKITATEDVAETGFFDQQKLPETKFKGHILSAIKLAAT